MTVNETLNLKLHFWTVDTEIPWAEAIASQVEIIVAIGSIYAKKGVEPIL